MIFKLSGILIAQSRLALKSIFFKDFEEIKFDILDRQHFFGEKEVAICRIPKLSPKLRLRRLVEMLESLYLKIETIFKSKEKSLKGVLIYDTDFVVVDTELTGLDESRDEIVSIAGVRMRGKRIKIGNSFSKLIKPTCPLKKEGILVHGMVASDLQSSPHIKPVLEEFLDFFRDSIIVGHFIIIDLAFLKREIRRHLKEDFNPIAIDTLFLYRWLIKTKALPQDFLNFTSLWDIAKSMGIEAKEMHNALCDAYITAQLFQRLIVHLAELKVSTVDALLKIGKPNVSGYIGLKQQNLYQGGG